MTRHLITSALPYINGIKHLGNLVGSMLPSDVYARFQRARGNETLFICATDEHGSTTELAALEAGQHPCAPIAHARVHRRQSPVLRLERARSMVERRSLAYERCLPCLGIHAYGARLDPCYRPSESLNTIASSTAGYGTVRPVVWEDGGR